MLFFWLKKFVSHWLMPVPFCSLLILVGLVLLRRPARARLGRWLIVSALALIIVLGNRAVSRALIRPLETQYPPIPEFVAGQPLPTDLAACRYVYVLGGGNGHSRGMAATNLLSSSSLGRIVEATRILKALPDAKLIVSGPAAGDRPSHAVILARAAQTLGIAPDRILYIDNAHDTEDESRAARRIVGDAPVALVTSSWHMPRSVALCHSAGLTVVPCPADYRSHEDDPFYFDDVLWQVNDLERSTIAIRERIGYLWIALRGKS